MSDDENKHALVPADEIESAAGAQEKLAGGSTAAIDTSQPIIGEDALEIEERRNGKGAFEILGEALKNSDTFKAALINKLARRAPISPRVSLTKARDFVVSFGPKNIPPGETVTLLYRAEVLFRGEKIINTGDEDGLYLRNIYIGAREQFRNRGSLTSVKVFSSSSLGDGEMLDVVQPGLDIMVVVENVSNEVRRFSMTIFGRAVI